ncbi:molybdopterin cofactor-binding domain-containing protein [Spirillospora sp. CA-255316]
MGGGGPRGRSRERHFTIKINRSSRAPAPGAPGVDAAQRAFLGHDAFQDGDLLTLWDSTQGPNATQLTVAAQLGLSLAQVRVISTFVGGGFGSKAMVWDHAALAALAARHVGAPVRLALTREQMFSSTGHREEQEPSAPRSAATPPDDPSLLRTFPRVGGSPSAFRRWREREMRRGSRLIETVFRTKDVPRADRFDYWRELMSRTHAPLDLASEHSADFRAHQRTLRFGAVTVWPTAFHPMTIRRSPRLIKRSDPEVFHLSLVLQGHAEAAWDHQEALFRPHDWATNDSSRPGTFRAVHEHGVFRSIGIEMPKDLLSIPRDRADQVIGLPMSAREGIGALLAGALTRLTEDTGGYRESDGPRVATVLADLVSALFAHTLEACEDLTPETHRRTLLLRIRDFIGRHLHDPELSPGAIAAAHHISVSYLHRLFQADGVTVSAWIRRQRLERARQALADPALRTVPVHHIAARWGFTHHSAFTRAFRSAFGLAPSDYRHRALRAPA